MSGNQVSQAVLPTQDSEREWKLGPVRIELLLLPAMVLLVIVGVWLAYRYSYFPGFGLRYLAIPVLAVGLALLFGAEYIQYLYRLRSLKLAFQYLLAVLFGIKYPTLVIDNGRKLLKENEENLLDVIGGPGWLVVQTGNVVVLERCGGPPVVYGAGTHFISRRERIKEIISLMEHKDVIPEVRAFSRDGIEVILRNVNFRYRLDSGESTGNGRKYSLDNPHPFSEEAARRMVYRRSLSANGPESWHAGVRGGVIGEITSYINSHSLDQLMFPSQHGINPRAEIAARFESPATRKKMRDRGAELLFVGIGEFAIPNQDITQEWLRYWQTKLQGNASVARAYTDAQLQRYQELGRAEGQAEMLISILHALEDLDLTGRPERNLRNLVLLRTGQILDSMNKEVASDEEGPKMLSASKRSKS